MKNPHRILLCWVCEEQRATNHMGGHPICEDCLDHFLPAPAPKQEYTTADVVHDLRFGGGL